MRYTLVSLADAADLDGTDEMARLIDLGRRRARSGWVLRTLGDVAAELAVEQGCNLEGGGKEVLYSHCAGAYGGAGVGILTTPVVAPSADAFARAQTCSPDWTELNGPTRQALAGMVCRLLGPDLRSPIDLVLLHGTGRARPEAELRLLRRVCAQELIPIQLAPPAPTPVANWKIIAQVNASWSVGEVPLPAGCR
jgi:hypothetical protein